MRRRIVIGLLVLLAAAPAYFLFADGRKGEIREYRGQRLSPFDRSYDNSIAGPQKVDPAAYRLAVTGRVEKPLSLTLGEVLALPAQERVITLYCVEGWNERLLFKGVRLADILAKARPKPGVTTVVFRAADGYTSALSYDYVMKKDILLAFSINGVTLDAKRGFPFQVVAEDKLGYKWVKWVTGIELWNQPYKGYWEQRGYSDEAGVKGGGRD